MFTTGEHSMRGRWLGLYLYDPLYECSAILYGLTGGDLWMDRVIIVKTFHLYIVKEEEVNSS